MTEVTGGCETFKSRPLRDLPKPWRPGHAHGTLTGMQKAVTLLVFALAISAVATSLENDAANSKAQADPLSVKVPRAAGDMLKLASAMNGLDDTSNKRWHIKLSYEQFDQDGDNVHSGMVEEFFAGPKKYKRIILSDNLKQTDVANDSGLYRSGDQRWPDAAIMDVMDATWRPLRQARWGDHSTRPEKVETKLGSTRLPCVTLRKTESRIVFLGLPMFCFNPNSAMLRFVQENLAKTTTYDNIVPFLGRYVAKDISIAHDNKTFLKIHVEELGEISGVSEAFFAPPADSAGPLGGRIAIPPNIVMEYLVSTAEPNYPRGADGKVMVHFVVGKDGSVVEATASDGPEPLRKAILEAVKKYKFRPYLLLDQPVEVESNIAFQYNSR
ncbi:MAG: energy transducer TonB [Acidobacteriia bacterium]|nr:energy transducer TonB [Terriglobia bacterium]